MKNDTSGKSDRSIGSVFPQLVEKPFAVAFLVACLTFLIFSNTLSSSFHFDDKTNIVTNSQIKSFAAFRDLSGSRYVAFVTLALNYAVGGLHPVGYHLVNLVIHIANGVLVYHLVRALGRTPRLRAAGGPGPGIALVTALLFVVHPVQTQAVTYLVQRITSLSALFELLAVLGYLQWRLAAPGRRSGWGWYGTALVATVLAMKTKESSFTLPVLLLLVEVGFFPAAERRWGPLVPFGLLLPLIPWSLAPEGAVGMYQGQAGWARETTGIDRLSYLATQGPVLATYLRLLVWPVAQNLDYDFPVFHSWLEPRVGLAWGALLGLGGLGWVLFRAGPRWRLVGFGVVWFFVTLAVESSVIPIRDVLFEHRLYLPSVGLFLAGSVLAGQAGARWRGLPVVALAVVVALGAATAARNRVWADDLTLWRDVVAKSPKKARVHHSLGHAYLLDGRLEAAIAELQTSIQLDPSFPDAHNSLGVAYGQQGRRDAAIQEYQTAIRVKPTYARAYFNLGAAYAESGQLASAIQAYQTAIQIKDDFPEAHYNLGHVYLVQGFRENAIRELRVAIRLDPDFPEAHGNLGVVYVQQGRLDEAIQEFLTTLRLKPDLPEAEAKLANAYARHGQWDNAIGHYQRALRLRADWAEVQFELGQVYLNKGLTAEARATFEAVVRSHPDFAPAREALTALNTGPRAH